MKKLIALTAFAISLGAQSQTLVRPLQGGTGVANSNSATLTRSGAHALTITTAGATNVTLPTSGTLFADGAALTATTIVGSGNMTIGTTDFVVNTSGDQVGVGTASPRSGWRMDIREATANGLNVQAGDAGTDIIFSLGSASTADKFTVDALGNLVFIGTAIASGLTTAAGTPNSICQNNATKEITVNAALTCTVSSRDYKARIEPFTGDGLRMVAAMQPDTFFYRDRLDRPRIGLMAEDLAAIDPRLAEWTAEGKANSIDFPAMMGVMVKAIQQLQEEVNQLKGMRAVFAAAP